MNKILILDRQEETALELSRRLQSDTVRVICCEDSLTAASLLSKISVDAVIADVSSTFKDLKGIDRFLQDAPSGGARIPVILKVAGKAHTGEFQIAGDNQSIPQPIDLNQVIAFLRRSGLQVAEGRSSRTVFYCVPCQAIFPC